MTRLRLLPLLLLAACAESTIAVEGDAAPGIDGSMDAETPEDASFDWTPPTPFDGAVPPEDAGSGTMLYEVRSLDIDTDSDTGFDLDGFDTRSVNDPIGCGLLDGEGGVDNRLQNLNEIASTFGFDLASLLLGTEFDLSIEIRGYEGLPEDWVRADIYSGEGLVVENAPGLAVDGIVEIHFEELMLPVSPAFGGPIALPLRLVRLRFDLDEPSSTEALLGGAIVWDDGTDEDLESLVQLFIDLLGDSSSFPVGVIRTLITSNLDIALGGLGAPCDAISLASILEIERVSP